MVTIQQWFQEYENIIKSHNISAKQLWNTDETHVRTLLKMKRLAARLNGPQPAQIVFDGEEHKTNCMFINAAGEHLKSTVIFPLACIPAISKQLEDKFDYSVSENGWVTGEIFSTMVQTVFVRRMDEYRTANKLEGQYIMLVLDNHSSRNYLNTKMLYDEHKIIIHFIPPHASAILQPLDLGPNLALKQIYSKVYLPIIGDDAAKRRNDSLYALWMAESSALSAFTITQSWARSGLWPINPAAATRSCMVKPELNDTELGKRGPKCEPGEVLINGHTLVKYGRPDKENVRPANETTQKSKKQKIA